MASRLQQLGAVAGGDRYSIEKGAGLKFESADSHLSADVFVSRHGTAGAKSVVRGELHQELRTRFGIGHHVSHARVLLNRLLAMPIVESNELFAEFVTATEEHFDEAAQRGRASDPVILDLDLADPFTSEKEVYEAKNGVQLTVFERDEGLSFGMAQAKRQEICERGVSRAKCFFGIVYGQLVLAHWRTLTTAKCWRPDGEVLSRRAEAITRMSVDASLEERWSREYLQAGRSRIKRFHVAALPALKALHECLTTSPRLVRVNVPGEAKRIGLLIDEYDVSRFGKKALSVEEEFEADDAGSAAEDDDDEDDEAHGCSTSRRRAPARHHTSRRARQHRRPLVQASAGRPAWCPLRRACRATAGAHSRGWS